jgi:hypothetical protein
MTLLIILIAIWALYHFTRKPRLHRAWIPLHQHLPNVTFDDSGRVHITHVRQARYKSEFDADINYETQVYDPKDVVRVWFLTDTSGGFAAHTWMSFEFSDGRFLSSSVEMRKTQLEAFSIIKAAVFNYEIAYLLGDEQDMLYLRSNIRKAPVYMYPLNITPSVAEGVFRSVLSSVKQYHTTAHMYRLTKRQCTIEQFRNLREGGVIVPEFDYRYILNGLVDKVLYDRGLIDTSLPFEQVRAKYYITQKAQGLEPDEDFSKIIREGLL